MTREQMIDMAVRRAMRYFDMSPEYALRVIPLIAGNVRTEFRRIEMDCIADDFSVSLSMI